MSPDDREQLEFAMQLRTEDPMRAVSLFSDLMARLGPTPSFLGLRGHAYWEGGNLEAALSDFRAVLTLNPRSSVASQAAISLYWELGRLEAAKEQARAYLVQEIDAMSRKAHETLLADLELEAKQRNPDACD